MWRRKLSSSIRSPDGRWAAAWGCVLGAAVLAGCSGGGAEVGPLPSAGGFSVCAWHLGRYGLADRDGDGMPHEMKPDAECAAVADVISRLQPDVLCVQDLGDGAVKKRFTDDLARRGLRYPHVESLHRGDGGMALFSRFPILESRSALDLPYTIGAHRLVTTRGVIEADLDIRGRRTTVLVGDLKSKEFHPAGQTEMRRNEARIIGNRIEALLKADPAREILAAVHLSDEPDSKPWKEITESGLRDLRPADRFGEAWTESVGDTDAHLRTGFLFASGSLAGRTSPAQCMALRHPLVPVASPHRPLCVSFRPPPDPRAAAPARATP